MWRSVRFKNVQNRWILGLHLDPVIDQKTTILLSKFGVCSLEIPPLWGIDEYREVKQRINLIVLILILSLDVKGRSLFSLLEFLITCFLKPLLTWPTKVRRICHPELPGSSEARVN